MLNCKQTSELISQAIDRHLTRRERWNLRLHLWICAACRNFRKQLDWMRKSVKASVRQTEDNTQIRLPDDARQRIAQRISAPPES